MIDATTAGDVFDIPRGWVDGRGSLYCVDHEPDHEHKTPEHGHGVDIDDRCEWCHVILYQSLEWRRRIERAAAVRTNDGRVRY